jgi:hypothetical protein
LVVTTPRRVWHSAVSGLASWKLIEAGVISNANPPKSVDMLLLYIALIVPL